MAVGGRELLVESIEVEWRVAGRMSQVAGRRAHVAGSGERWCGCRWRAWCWRAQFP